MQQNEKQAFVGSSAEGISRVLNSNYAFIAESTTIDYQVQKKSCFLQQVGGLLDSKGYGLAFPKGIHFKSKRCTLLIQKVNILNLNDIHLLICMKTFIKLNLRKQLNLNYTL